ncbi:MAG: DnaJ domain-containing protein [Candidatus Omnitrophota bacterium]
MAHTNYYEILGVPETADADAIKKAYRKLAVRHHPDKNPGNAKQAEAKFKEISEAYYVLSDSKRRKDYDTMRRFGGTGARGFSGNYARAQGFDFEELLRQFGGGGTVFRQGGGRSSFQGNYSNFADIFEDLFSGFGIGSRGSSGFEEFATWGGSGEERKVPEARLKLRIGKEKASRGGTVRFKTREGKTIQLKIPPRTRAAQKFRLRGQGPGGRDLILEIAIA